MFERDEIAVDAHPCAKVAEGYWLLRRHFAISVWVLVAQSEIAALIVKGVDQAEASACLVVHMDPKIQTA